MTDPNRIDPEPLVPMPAPEITSHDIIEMAAEIHRGLAAENSKYANRTEGYRELWDRLIARDLEPGVVYEIPVDRGPLPSDGIDR